MDAFDQLAMASLLGLGTTSSSLPGAAIGLYVPFSKRPLASMLTKAGYRPAAIFDLWSTVLVADVFAAAAGKAFIGGDDALAASLLRL